MKSVRPILLFLLLLFSLTEGQVVLRITSLPKDTPKNAKIYMASNLNGWNPKDSLYELKRDVDGSYTTLIPSNSGTVGYKFTLGSWETAEANEKGNAIDNRTLIVSNKPSTVLQAISSWQQAKIRNNTASPNVKILSENFAIPQLKTTRRIWIYLPQDYANSDKRYPVVYMEDGQNLFNEALSFAGEWKADETMDALADTGKQAIIVGIDNGGADRLNEYSPWENPKYGGGHGEHYADFLAQTLKPFIDKNYRTLPQPKNTALVGSSMGGLISFYTGLKYPQKFGKLGIFSPSFWFAKNDVLSYVRKNSKVIKKSKFYFLAGKKESAEMVSDIEDVVNEMVKKRISTSHIKVKIDDNGTHSEQYWSQEFGAAYLWLFAR